MSCNQHIRIQNSHNIWRAHPGCTLEQGAEHHDNEAVGSLSCTQNLSTLVNELSNNVKELYLWEIYHEVMNIITESGCMYFK